MDVVELRGPSTRPPGWWLSVVAGEPPAGLDRVQDGPVAGDHAGGLQAADAQIGFTVAVDEPYGDQERWIEVVPPDKGVALVLSRRQPGEVRPEVPELLPHSPVLFTCDDLQQTYQELTGRGVSFPTAPTKMPFGWWSLFEDDEGTRYALEQRP
jgi:lactoylglutathione lyase